MASKLVPSGYEENDFLSEPDDALKCLICLAVARDPWQHGKCGKLFCEKCLDEHGKDKPCPNCRMKQPLYLEDAKSKREIKALRVKCENAERGCKWVGTIGELRQHLFRCGAICPDESKQKDTTVIACKYESFGCGVKSIRKDVKIHERIDKDLHLQLALNTVTKLQLAKKESDIELKRTVSSMKKMRKVKESLKRERDVTEAKLKSAIKEKNETAKVKASMKRERDAADAKLKLAMKEKNDIAIKLASTKKEKDDIEGELVATVAKLEACNFIKRDQAMLLRLTDYLRNNRPQIFHICTDGYNLSITVYPGEGYSGYVSVNVCFLEGKHDDEVDWPFIGTIKLELLNQLSDMNNHYKKISYSKKDNARVGSSRCIRLISESELYYNHSQNTLYLLFPHDMMFLKVSVQHEDRIKDKSYEATYLIITAAVIILFSLLSFFFFKQNFC